MHRLLRIAHETDFNCHECGSHRLHCLLQSKCTANFFLTEPPSQFTSRLVVYVKCVLADKQTVGAFPACFPVTVDPFSDVAQCVAEQLNLTRESYR